MNKKEIRQYIASKRKLMTEDEKIKMDKIIYAKVISDDSYLKAETIFVYVSYKKEVDTHNIIKHALKCGKLVYVPVIISVEEGMVAVRIDSFSDLKLSQYGMLQPDFKIDNIADPSKIDLVIVPGAAFDKFGGRVGYGAGMYDKYFLKLSRNASKIAVAYDYQILKTVPMEEHDIKVDFTITN